MKFESEMFAYATIHISLIEIVAMIQYFSYHIIYREKINKKSARYYLFTSFIHLMQRVLLFMRTNALKNLQLGNNDACTTKQNISKIGRHTYIPCIACLFLK